MPIAGLQQHLGLEPLFCCGAVLRTRQRSLFFPGAARLNRWGGAAKMLLCPSHRGRRGDVQDPRSETTAQGVSSSLSEDSKQW